MQPSLDSDDFDFEFDEDFEPEVSAEYTVMGAMRFDREAGTASCNFEIEEEEDDAFKIPVEGRSNPDEKKKSKGK